MHKNKWRCFFCTVLTLILYISLAVPAFGETPPIENPISGYEPVAAASKGRASDVIAIAKTQDGYKGVICNKGMNNEKRYSYFGDVWDAELAKANENSIGHWCSEFASWCHVQAKVPGAKPLISVTAWRNYYKNSLYMMYASAENASIEKETRADVVKNWFKGFQSNGTLKLKDLKEGDILLILTDKRLAGGTRAPHHTAIFDHYSGNEVFVIDGNVKANSSSSQVRVDGKYEAREVICVVRPDYNQ